MFARAFPEAWCEGCGSRDACAAEGVTRPEYPRCRAPLRGVDLGRTVTLLEWLARAGGAEGTPVRALMHAVVERFRRDRLAFSEILEPSFSCDREGAHLFRFSYAFPGLRADPAGVASSLLDFCRPFGPSAEGACRAVLRASRSPAVSQLLFGYADDGGGRSRVKLYVQFHAAEARAALDLAGRMLGRPLSADVAGGAPLHLMCFDVGARGLAGAKLYFVVPRVHVSAIPDRIGPVPLAAALATLGVSELRDVLAVHRVEGPDGAGLDRAAEVDFSLPENDLRWSDVCALPEVRAHLDRSPEIAALEAGFRLAVRRISGSVGDGRKLNVYYVLAELGREHAARGAA